MNPFKLKLLIQDAMKEGIGIDSLAEDILAVLEEWQQPETIISYKIHQLRSGGPDYARDEARRLLLYADDFATIAHLIREGERRG